MSLSRTFATLNKNITKMIAAAEEQSKLVEGDDEQKAAYLSSIESELSLSVYSKSKNKRAFTSPGFTTLQTRFKIAVMQYAKAQYGVSAKEDAELDDILFYEDVAPKRRKTKGKEVISLVEEGGEEQKEEEAEEEQKEEEAEEQKEEQAEEQAEEEQKEENEEKEGKEEDEEA